MGFSSSYPSTNAHTHTGVAGDGGRLGLSLIIPLWQGNADNNVGVQNTFTKNADFQAYSEANQVANIQNAEGVPTGLDAAPWRKTINLRRLGDRFDDIRFVAKVFHHTAAGSAQVQLWNVTDAAEVVELNFANNTVLIATSADISATMRALTDALKTIAIRVKSSDVARKNVVEAYLECRQ